MQWIEVKAYRDCEGNYESNVPLGSILVSNGTWVEHVEIHGWDDQEYYFHNGIGKLEGVRYFMPLPSPPKE
jgi:hypothetical protein